MKLGRCSKFADENGLEININMMSLYLWNIYHNIIKGVKWKLDEKYLETGSKNQSIYIKAKATELFNSGNEELSLKKDNYRISSNMSWSEEDGLSWLMKDFIPLKSMTNVNF